MFVSHGGRGRPLKGNGRKRKGVDEYAAENPMDFTTQSIIREGKVVQTLICRFCCQSIGARSDRIKEHIASKRHQKLKTEAFFKTGETGQDFTLKREHTPDDDENSWSSSGWLPDSPITSMQTGNDETKLFEADVSENPSNENSRSVSEILSSPESMHSPRLENRDSGALPQDLGTSWESSWSAGTSETLQQRPKKSAPQLLCLQWGNHELNISKMFTKFLNLTHLVDVTLWCEGRTIKCHKIVLAACSPYFESLFTEVPTEHPIIFLKDMKFWEVEYLVEFMYKGVINVSQGKLQSLLLAAKSLRIKGLGSVSNDGEVDLRSK